ncbi:MAG: PQQ-dependent sugar dehydrogenase, partial [Acidobacteriota bacterium]|nr:PQQ-dependent sugar dehydrogenase [Acidobacteriota bacterium]
MPSLRSSLAVSIGCVLLSTSAFAGAPGCDGIAPVDNNTLVSVPIITGLNGPVLALSPPGDTERIFVVEQDGVIRLHKRGDPPGTHTVFLDISANVTSTFNEQGLLGLAFHPDYENNRRFVVNYTQGTNTIVSTFLRNAVNPDIADAGSEKLIIQYAQPETNHNGGDVDYGPDGFLYIYTGDGGGGGDNHGTCGNGQNPQALLGKILRIDPDRQATEPIDCGAANSAYTIPADNPFVGNASTCDEIWALGMRNPWRNAFDFVTGALYTGDVGQNCWEEINWTGSTTGGENYGWRQMEGDHCYPAFPPNCDVGPTACAGSPNCNDPSLTDPIVEFRSDLTACSVVGGHVYRGCRMPNFDGVYFYGDYCEGFVRSFVESGGAPTQQTDWTAQVDPGGALAFTFSSFGEDGRGELLLVDQSGVVSKITPPFTDYQVSGPGGNGVDQFLLAKGGDW